jgi:hypothetical protein
MWLMTWQNNTIGDVAADVVNLCDENIHHRYDDMANDVAKIL